VQERDNTTNLQDIGQVTKTKQVDRNDVVKCHLDEIILASFEEMRDESPQMKAHED